MQTAPDHDPIRKRQRRWWEYLVPSLSLGAFFSEFVHFLWERKLWWLSPIIVFLVLLSILIAFGQGSALAPLIYAIF